MTSYDRTAPERSVLRIVGEMNIYRAGELKQALADALEANNAVDIDLSEVDEIDTAGVQLIVAARKQALMAGKELLVVAHSPAIGEALELLDLALCLEIGSGACVRCERSGKCFGHSTAETCDES